MKILNTPEPAPAKFATKEPCLVICGALYVWNQPSDGNIGCASRVELESGDLKLNLTNFKFSLDIGWTCLICETFNRVAFLHGAYDLSLEKMVAEVIRSRIPGSVIPCTEDSLRTLLMRWRTTKQYVDGPTLGSDSGTYGSTQHISRRAVAHGLDPEMVHYLISQGPPQHIEDVIKVAEALKRAAPKQVLV
jgi:hypothetical protein